MNRTSAEEGCFGGDEPRMMWIVQVLCFTSESPSPHNVNHRVTVLIWINFSLDVPGNRKTFTKPVPECKNVSAIQPPAGYMTCTCSTVYIGDPIIMNDHYDGRGHSSSEVTFIRHTNSLVLPLSLIISLIIVIILTVSHARTRLLS